MAVQIISSECKEFKLSNGAKVVTKGGGNIESLPDWVVKDPYFGMCVNAKIVTVITSEVAISSWAPTPQIPPPILAEPIGPTLGMVEAPQLTAPTPQIPPLVETPVETVAPVEASQPLSPENPGSLGE